MLETTVGGLSLRAYAAVYAALAEGFPLDRVLEHEGLSEEEWGAIDEAWSDAIDADEEVEGPLGEALDARLLELQASYRRPVPPLDEDLGAWLRFVRAWSGEADPPGALGRLGLNANDLVRLHRHWSARLADDASLREEAARILQSPAAAAPPPRPAPLVLLPSSRKERPHPRPPEPAAAAPKLPRLSAPLPHAAPATAAPPAPRPLAPRVGEETILPSDAVDPFASFPVSALADIPPAETVPPPDPTVVLELTMTQYAALCAELEVMPEHADAIFIKYGVLNERLRARIDRIWSDKLEGDAATYAEWRHLYQHFKEHWTVMRRLQARR